VPFFPTLQSPGIFNFLGSIIIAFIWGYFLGFSFFSIYNFYDRRFSKK
jgi:predicted PurR-regulated permease PerM